MGQIQRMHETAMRLRDNAREAEQDYYREKMLQTAYDLERRAAELEATRGTAFGASN